MALKQQFIPLSDRAGWDAALQNLPHSFAHTHAYTAAIAAQDAAQTFLYTAEDAAFRAACPLTVRHFEGAADVVSPYGFAGFAFSGACEKFSDAFPAFMAKQGYVAGYIVQYPLVDAAALVHAEEHVHGKECFLLDLRVDEEKRLMQLASDHRSRLRQWWKENPQLVTDKAVLKKPFMSLYPEAMRRAGAKESYFFSDATLEALIESDASLLIGVEAGGVVEAVSLFLYQGTYAEYYLNACTQEGKRHARGLVWHAAVWLQGQGVSTLNLGCGIAESDALEEFKRRFGGQVQRFSIFKQVYQPEAYASLCHAQEADAADRSGFFPAYRAPRPAFDKRQKEA